MTKLYQYHENTGEFINEFDAPLDPLTKTPVVVAFSTDVPPPQVTTNQRAVFLDVDGKVDPYHKMCLWKIVPDYRGMSYWTQDGTYHTITELNVKPPRVRFQTKPFILQEAKDEKWTEIKRERAKHEFGTFEWNGFIFDADQTSQSRIVLAVMGAQLAISQQQEWSIEWRLADNSLVTIDSFEMIQVAEAMGANTANAHEHANQLRTLIDSATTKEEIEAIVW